MNKINCTLTLFCVYFSSEKEVKYAWNPKQVTFVNCVGRRPDKNCFRLKQIRNSLWRHIGTFGMARSHDKAQEQLEMVTFFDLEVI